MFQLLDESNKLIKRCNIWLSGHSYKSDAQTGQIFIPFTNVDKQNEFILLERDDDPSFNICTTFHHKKEQYKFDCGFYIDREQLLEKKRGVVMIRPVLMLNNQRVSLKLLEDVKLSIKIKSSSSGVDTDRTFNNLTLSDDREGRAEFSLPMDPSSIIVTINASVKSMTKNSKENLSKSKTFDINSMNRTSKISSLYTVPLPNKKFMVCLLGKNGEAMPSVDVKVSAYHENFHTNVNFEYHLVTDDKGRIYLPSMENYTRFIVNVPSLGLRVCCFFSFRFVFCFLFPGCCNFIFGFFVCLFVLVNVFSGRGEFDRNLRLFQINFKDKNDYQQPSLNSLFSKSF